MAEERDPATAGRVLGWLYVLSGLTAVPMMVLPNDIDFVAWAMPALGGLCLVIGGAALRAPWQRWPSWVMWFPLLGALLLVAVSNIVNGGDPYRQLLFYPLIFTWVGVFQPPGSSLRIAPAAALAYVVPLVISGANAAAMVTVLYAVPILVVVGEVLSWQTSRFNRVRAELSHHAHHDPLTGLANRRRLLDVLTRRLQHADDEGRQVGLLVLDLDGFKLVNDTFGHAAGDELLIQIGEVLCGSVRGSDVVGRLGGDEFAVMVSDTQALEVVAQRIGDRIGAFSRDAAVPVSASVGAVRSRPGETADGLIRRGDELMYRSKDARRLGPPGGAAERGGEASSAPDPGFESAGDPTAAELRRAIADGEIVVHYQPIVSLGDGAARKVEALARWDHPDLGLLPPAQFIPAAEANGAITALGEHVLRTAAVQVAAWRMGSHPGLELTVNLSPRELGAPDLVDRVCRTLDAVGLDRHAAWFEVTESSLIDPAAVPVLDRLIEAGVRLAIDDFGTGYANLANLRQIRVNAIKIDRSFVNGLGRSPGDTAIVRNTVNLAAELGLVVVAEGVETDAQANFLRAAGCRFAQGYLFSPARDAREAALWFARPEDHEINESPRPCADREQVRLAALAATGIVGSEPEAAYDSITEAAAATFDVPVALISFVEADRVWHKARIGVESTATPRRWSLSAHVVAAADGTVVIEDAARDSRFARHPLVVGGSGIRFFAGAVVTDPGGQPVGAVCVADRRPRVPSAAQLSLLRRLADLTSAQLRARSDATELEQLRRQRTKEERARTTRHDLFQMLVDNSPDLITLLDVDGTILYANPGAAYFGYDAQQWIGRSVFDLVHPDDTSHALIALTAATTEPGPGTPIELRLRASSGRWVLIEATGTAYDDDGGRRVVVVARDISERHAAPY